MAHCPDILRLYQEKAEYWLRQRATSSFFEKKYLDWVVENIPPGGEILDLGCGDGWPIADYFIQKGFAVTGVDGTAAMIERAKERFPGQHWYQRDMRGLNLAKRFHAVLAWDSFFHLKREEQREMFPVFKDHLLPGGCLLFTAGPANGEAIGDMDGMPLYHSSLSPTEYRELFRLNSLTEVAYDPEDPDCGKHTVWRCRA